MGTGNDGKSTAGKTEEKKVVPPTSEQLLARVAPIPSKPGGYQSDLFLGLGTSGMGNWFRRLTQGISLRRDIKPPAKSE
jgi:hypothetical protein